MLWVSAVFVFTVTLGEGDYIAYGLICVLGGSCLGVDQAIAASIQADVIDEDTAAGGDGRAGAATAAAASAALPPPPRPRYLPGWRPLIKKSTVLAI